MIKINLLPTKKKPPKKVIDLQQQLILGLSIIVLLMLGMYYFWKQQTDRIQMLSQIKITAEKKLHDQENTLKEVQSVEDQRKKVSDKIGIIEQLKKNQSGPVRLLDELSKALPRNVNIASMNEANRTVRIEGDAFSNDDIVRFIDNLKASPMLVDVALQESSQVRRDGVDLYQYKLQFGYKGM